MSRRFGILLLVAAVTFLGATACPRSTLFCSVARQAAHDCCGEHTALRARDCCCHGSVQQSAVTLATADPHGQLSQAHLLLAIGTVDWGINPTERAVKTRYQLNSGPAPPDTLVARHSLLLL